VSAPAAPANTPASGSAAAPPQPTTSTKTATPTSAPIAAAPPVPAAPPSAPAPASNPAGIVKEAVLDVPKPESDSGKTPKATGDSPTQLKAGKQVKTLQCTECKAMNYASEWYCERCGAELTVV